MGEELKRILMELRRRFQELYGPRLVEMVLYGSLARGDEEAGSDIDMLVVLEDDVSPAEEIARTGGIVADLSLRHNVVISCVFVDERRFAKGTGPLLRNIRREGLPV
jgi:predicted nucleotidyltransferase